MTDAYTYITKPVGANYSNVNTQGREQYDQSTLTYDDSSTFYDGVDINAYTNIAKPSFPIVLLAYYSESNQTTNLYVDNDAGDDGAFWGQGFTNTTSSVLDSCKFYVKKFGSPTGSMVAKMYASTGTFGVDAIPTGSALATSDNFNIATIPNPALGKFDALVTFTFSGSNRATLQTNTNYFLVITYPDFVPLSGNSLGLGIDNVYLTAPGNSASSANGSSWTTSLIVDVPFYVYGVGSVYTNVAKPIT